MSDEIERAVFELSYSEYLKDTEYDFPEVVWFEWESKDFNYDFSRWLVENTEWNGQDNILIVG